MAPTIPIPLRIGSPGARLETVAVFGFNLTTA
jgi:hypothetical protein